jgi:putative ABC transport system permease protein
VLSRGRRDVLGTFVAVLLGTAILTLALTLLTSGSPVTPARFGDLAAAVVSPAVRTPADPFPERRPWSSAAAEALAGRLATVPGVTAAVPDRTFYAQPVLGGRPAAVTEGHGWASAALAPYPLVAGRAPAGDKEVVLGRAAGVPVGGPVTLLTATGPSEWTVSGLIAADGVYVADPVAARLSPGVRVIGVLGDPEPAALHPAARSAAAPADAGTVLTGTALGELEPRADARTRWIGLQVLTAMSALGAFACVFVIASTSAYSVSRRRRTFGLLRAVGATPGQIRRSVLREAATVGAAASAAGVTLGVLLAPVIGSVLVDAGFQPPSYQTGPRLWPIAAGLAAGPLVAVLGAAAAARRAARIGPLEALREAEIDARPMTRTRWSAGLACAALGAVAGLLTTLTGDLTDLATYALVSAMAVVVAATLLAPVVVPPLISVLLGPFRGPIGTIARESARTGVRRTASTAAPVLLTVAFAAFIAGNVQTSAGAYAERRAAQVRAGAVLTPDGTPGLTDAAVAAAPGAAALLPADAYLDSTVLAAVGVEPETLARAVPATAAAVRALTTPDAVVLTASRAAQGNHPIGASITVTLGDGEARRLRVAGVIPDRVVPAEMVLSRTTVRAHDPSALTSAVLLPAGMPGAAPLGSRVVDPATYARQADAAEDRLIWIFTVLLIGVSAGYGVLAVANTLLMAATHRIGDIRRLRLAGATPRQVRLALATESAAVVLIGTLLGGASAALALWGSVAGLRAQTGLPVSVSMPWPVLAATVGACLTLAVLTSLVPAAQLGTTRAARAAATRSGSPAGI